MHDTLGDLHGDRLQRYGCRDTFTSIRMSPCYTQGVGFCLISFQASFILTHDGSGLLLNASVSFVLGEVGEGVLTQEFRVEFIEVRTSQQART